jgi:hypothetical protein
MQDEELIPENSAPSLDYFLKFEDETLADAVLFDMVHDGEGYTKQPRYAAIDVIGTIYEPTGQMLPASDDSGDAVPEMAAIPGWHVNVRHTSEAPELEQYRVHPATPHRMWA